MNFADWFWKLLEGFGLDLGAVSPVGQAVIDMIPVIFAITVVIVLAVTISGFGRGEKEETEGLTELDMEVARIRRLQGK